jgi:hypothetical protein
MITPEDFLDHAKSLLHECNEKNFKEINLRSSLSRSYYYLYHKTLEYLEANHKSSLIKVIDFELLRTKKYKSPDYEKINNIDKNYLHSLLNLHSIVASTLREIDNQKSLNFKGFRDTRNEADYDLSCNFGYEEVETTVKDMENFILGLK